MTSLSLSGEQAQRRSQYYAIYLAYLRDMAGGDR